MPTYRPPRAAATVPSALPPRPKVLLVDINVLGIGSAGLLCREFDAEWPVVLATSDTDWLQALRGNVAWHSPSNGRHVTEVDLGDTSLIKDGPFLSTDHYVRAKALAGDAVDGIDGVIGIGLKTAAKILREYDAIETLWASHDSGAVIRGVALRRAAGPDYRDTYRRNLQLIDWRRAPPLPGNHVVTGAPGNLARYASLCYDWGLVHEPCALAEDASGIVRDAVERTLAAATRRVSAS
ncbi:MAG: 5'-3' exonuclease H3TH domain-containing protein [Actinomycetes bacterium]